MSPPTTSARSARPAASSPVALNERVHEAGAAGREVVRGRIGAAELVGEQRGRRRKVHVGRDGRDDDQVDVLGRERRPARAPAARRARARSDIASPSAAMRRSLIPVRAVIHSSDVSTIFASSSFVTTRSGTWQPSPVIEIGRAVRAAVHRPPRRSACRARPARRRPTRAPCPCRPGRARPRRRRRGRARRPAARSA